MITTIRNFICWTLITIATKNGMSPVTIVHWKILHDDRFLLLLRTGISPALGRQHFDPQCWSRNNQVGKTRHIYVSLSTDVTRSCEHHQLTLDQRDILQYQLSAVRSSTEIFRHDRVCLLSMCNCPHNTFYFDVKPILCHSIVNRLSNSS